MQNPRILVVTSCTGEKIYKAENPLTLEDFQDATRLQVRSAALDYCAIEAGKMYSGIQHLRAMEGVEILRQSLGNSAVDVAILSAAYGLIPENQRIVPYEVTFNQMKAEQIDDWSRFLEIKQKFEEKIEGYDLVFILLGKNYLRALQLPVKTQPQQTFIFLASAGSTKYIQDLAAKTFIFPLSNTEAKRYRYGSVGLKGFLFRRFAEEISKKNEILQSVYQKPECFKNIINYQPMQLEPAIETPTAVSKISTILTPKNTDKPKSKAKLVPIPDIPPAPNLALGMQYFIPEWDDRVDPGYNFLTDKFTDKRKTNDDIYAHEIYSSPNYDGILVSKVIVDKSPTKKNKIKAAGGIHEFIRFSGEIMGDCGAFGYVKEEVPRYSTEEILEYYHTLGFDYGVSVDHLIFGPFAEPGIREKRYNLTLKNAEDFINQHRDGIYQFTPIGAVQGWSPQSYSKAVQKTIAMGYDYIALGGLARAKTEDIIEILRAIQPHLKPHIRMHLFGVGRIDATLAFRHLGVTSFDSASSLRRAWLGSGDNYHTLEGEKYTAVRIPPVERSGLRIKRVVEAGISDVETLKTLEQKSLQAMLDFEAGDLSLEKTIEVLMDYDNLLELPRDGIVNPTHQAKRVEQHREMYRQLLSDRPWKDCDCKVCQEIGIQVVIFRGNDRNRRRGFHNTYVFYKRFKELLANISTHTSGND